MASWATAAISETVRSGGVRIHDRAPQNWIQLLKRMKGNKASWEDVRSAGFQFARLNARGGRPKYSCPLDAPTSSANLWKHYASNETVDRGVSGYYLTGLRRNIHGGIHLFPDEGTQTDQSGRTPVRAMAPGYIVAARLPGVGTKAIAPDVLKHLGAWPGFVIIRHEIQEKPSTQGEKGRTGILYSLYMHLAPPGLVQRQGEPHASIDTSDRYFTEVPWFKKLVQQRHGAFVRSIDEPLGPKAPKDARPLGELVWAAEKVEKSGALVSVEVLKVTVRRDDMKIPVSKLESMVKPKAKRSRR